MENDPNEGGGGSIMILAAAGMVLCCALPLLLATGGLGAIAAWFLDGATGWLLLAAALTVLAAGLVLRYRRGASKWDPTREADSASANPYRVKKIEDRTVD